MRNALAFVAVLALALVPSPALGAVASAAAAPDPVEAAAVPSTADVTLALPVTPATNQVALDWGSVPLRSIQVGTVHIANTSAEPLTILAMRASCSCTALDDLSGKVLAAGETLSTRVSMDTRNIPGPQKSALRFVFSDRTNAEVILQFDATRAVETDPPFIRALDVSYGVLRVRSTDGKPFRIIRANGEAPVYGMAFDPVRDEPKSEYMLVWNLEGYDPDTCADAAGRPMPLYWVIETDHADAPVIDVRVRHDPCTRLDLPRADDTRRWYLSQNHEVLGRIEAGATHEFEVSMKWLRNSPVNDLIARATTESNAFDVEVARVTRDGDEVTALIRVTVSPDARGFIYDRVTLHGENPNNRQWLPVMGTAVAPAVGG